MTMITQTGFISLSWPPQQTCPACNGTGIIVDYSQPLNSTSPSTSAAHQRCCWECNGRGMVPQ